MHDNKNGDTLTYWVQQLLNDPRIRADFISGAFSIETPAAERLGEIVKRDNVSYFQLRGKKDGPSVHISKSAMKVSLYVEGGMAFVDYYTDYPVSEVRKREPTKDGEYINYYLDETHSLQYRGDNKVSIVKGHRTLTELSIADVDDGAVRVHYDNFDMPFKLSLWEYDSNGSLTSCESHSSVAVITKNGNDTIAGSNNTSALLLQLFNSFKQLTLNECRRHMADDGTQRIVTDGPDFMFESEGVNLKMTLSNSTWSDLINKVGLGSDPGTLVDVDAYYNTATYLKAIRTASLNILCEFSRVYADHADEFNLRMLNNGVRFECREVKVTVTYPPTP